MSLCCNLLTILAISLSSDQCPICRKILRGSNKRNLQRHINLIHLKLKPYQCHYCGRSFGLKAYLKAHVLTHEPEGRQDENVNNTPVISGDLISQTESSLNESEYLLAALKGNLDETK